VAYIDAAAVIASTLKQATGSSCDGDPM